MNSDKIRKQNNKWRSAEVKGTNFKEYYMRDVYYLDYTFNSIIDDDTF
jgi:hypothetical protein